jgi:hypothetical protein
VLRRATAQLLALGALLPSLLAAQSGTAREGALFLVIPVGAHAAGMGQAAAATLPGPEALWWNPAALAFGERTELVVNFNKILAGTGTALTYTRPSGRAGVFSFGVFYFDNGGAQEQTDRFGSLGTLYPQAWVVAGSYAATFGSRVSAAVTYKFLRDGVNCTGSCDNLPTHNSTTSAADFGVQFVPDSARRLRIGAMVRNIGPALQVNDFEQADPLPLRMHLGASYLLPAVERAVPGGSLLLTGELVAGRSSLTPAFRGGAEFGFKDEVFLRGGLSDKNADGTSVTLGLGLKRGGLQLDFSRGFGGVSSDADSPPTYLTLRFKF